MRSPWKSFLESLYPSRSGPSASEDRRMPLLQAGIALAIALAAGPEIFAAMEMTALLEVLGASLFLTACAAGAKLAARRVWRAVCDIALPAAEIYVIRFDPSVRAKTRALVSCAVNAAWWLGGILVLGVSTRSIIEGVA